MTGTNWATTVPYYCNVVPPHVMIFPLHDMSIVFGCFHSASMIKDRPFGTMRRVGLPLGATNLKVPCAVHLQMPR